MYKRQSYCRLHLHTFSVRDFFRFLLLTTAHRRGFSADGHSPLIEFALKKEPILDQKPSSILLYIKELSGDSKEAFERQVLLNRLPEAARTALSTLMALNNKEFAKEANE